MIENFRTFIWKSCLCDIEITPSRRYARAYVVRARSKIGHGSKERDFLNKYHLPPRYIKLYSVE